MFDFSEKSKAAAASAKRLEWLRINIEMVKMVCVNKYRATYEACRIVANKMISDPELRFKVFSRDEFKCVACGAEEGLSVDHIKSVKYGGGNELDNFQTL